MKMYNVTSDAFKKADFSSVRSLDISNASITSEDLREISNASIEELNLDYCTLLEDDAMTTVATLANLKSLSIDGCAGISDKGITCLTNLKNLEVLSTRACYELTDDACSSMAMLRLTKLSLSSCEKITDEGVRSLATIKTLIDLELPGFAEISDRGILALCYGDAPLQQLLLTSLPEVTGDGLLALGKLESLRTVWIDNIRAATAEIVEEMKARSPRLEVRLS